ncbi:predicted endonuclease distantly related to archaeal Holliday junction resolvase [Halorhodospira halochloris]|uniref:UPF0102 protein HH1059_18350 n=1 Tax=Halorhodospira halochloris TaxID=1052 RepID=A0A0X8XCT2_HALHR|nr:YraN family protein [Halorhodospira halochloris]MBK1651660.1 YraN family protein [Halorhodospira halochloris]BAU58524.2 predicted endonuclease distantly related to archaeal Holliday junction resolvase [Halorhodospira halochloris]
MKRSPLPSLTRSANGERVPDGGKLSARLSTGEYAEKLARDFLKKQGLTTLATRFRVNRGEIDLVMADGKTTVFVEVRYRSSPAFGGAASSISRKKRQSLTRAASYWLALNPGSARFDVIAIDGEELEWIQNAFSATP